MTLEEAARLAKEKGLSSYGKWCDDLERRYDVMPPWYWHASLREDNYITYVRRTAAIIEGGENG